ncbi:unnamed protein product [Trichogramma brassicae]|uniref:PH domain-containing protein n=1 Tax=Trichogramma brassicae TaxID=86971 RepID=A0A6H5HYG7_9HYME|nr:unnamed protein product [Trichogramma brassicae]
MHQSDALGLLRDVVTFLSSLDEIELTEALQSCRAELLAKSRELLNREPAASGDSPEPYLDMSIGKSSCASSSIVLGGGDNGEPTSTTAIGSTQEYVNADVSTEIQQKRQQQQQRSSLQHYYETFQDLSGMFKSISNNNNNNEKELSKKNSIGSVGKDELDDEVSLYAGYTAAQARDKASKCGPLLHLRRERNMFAPFNVFWLNRSCWVCLCGTHLLLFANERGSRPYLVAPLRGYKSRAAPDAIPRDPRRSEAAFEVYCPGDRTFRFSAKSVAEMRDWVETISACLNSNGDDESDHGSGFRPRAATFGELLELDATERACMEMVKEEKEKYQDVNLPMQLVRSKSKDDSVKATTEEAAAAGAPPLPARSQVRRLPSLPSSPLPQENDDDRGGPSEELYDDEGLYHRIEDIRGQDYQNVQPVQRLTKIKVRRAGANAAEANNETAAVVGETYDDVHGSTPYDDVKSPSAKANSSPKPRSPLKRFFSDRMIGTIGRKDSTKRDNSASKSSTSSTKSSTTTSSMPPSPTSRPTPPPTTTTTTSSCFELPSYDDVSSILPSQVDLDERNGAAVDEENYLCPPPPRPIYSRPATIVKCTTRDDDDDDEEIYDDIGCAQVVINNDSACVDLLRQYPKNSSFLSDLQPSLCDQEHYQVPKSHNRRIIDVVEQQQQRQEELYDDVSLSENFKNRPRDTPPKPPTTTTTATTTTSAWSTFSSGKRARVFERDDGNVATTIGGDIADSAAGAGGAPPIAKVKPLQKFINKMENTLSKVNKTSGYA